MSLLTQIKFKRVRECAMKLKPVIKKELYVEQQEREETPKKKNTKRENKLPDDVYKPMFEPVRLLVKEAPSHRDPTTMVKQYLELSVKRFDDDEAMPFVWVQMYQESDFYTGYLKGKTIYLPLEMLYDFIEGLKDLSDKCEEMGIE